jgi:hypothetical protein
MGTRYATVLTGGVVPTYNDNPPPDDNSQTEANRVKYSTVTGDLTAPLHSATQNVDGNLISHFNEGPTTKSSNYTTDADDYNSVIECTGSPAIDLLAPATAGKSYRVTIVNAGAGIVRVGVSGGGNIGSNSCHKLGPEQAGTYFVNDAENGYYLKHTANEFPADTAMVFYNASAPVGWSKVTAPDESILRVTDASPTGGTAGGTYTFSATFGSTLSEGASPGIGNHTLTGAQSGVPDHTHTNTAAQTSTNNTGNSEGGDSGATVTVVTGGVTGGAQNAASGHSHTADLRVKWAAVIVAQKDGDCGGGGGPT